MFVIYSYYGNSMKNMTLIIGDRLRALLRNWGSHRKGIRKG